MERGARREEKGGEVGRGGEVWKETRLRCSEGERRTDADERREGLIGCGERKSVREEK